ncbi:MAG: hypothetical protein LBK41_01130 [Clostridiales bacterium]|jgi:bifunctional UDP-N-acetylglucosamine pyrophosphorylase/glucosamine-1-phosphate N-acetyltransferase|nr:hypothetical protein [Clostridiales bacterium]
METADGRLKLGMKKYVIHIPDEKAAEFALIPILGSPAAAFFAGALGAGDIVGFYAPAAAAGDAIARDTNLRPLGKDEFEALCGEAEVIVPRGYIPGSSETARLNYVSAADRARTAMALKRSINAGHMSRGVFIVDPESAYIGPLVTIESGAAVWPGNILEGRTSVGAETELGAGNRIKDSVIGAGCFIQYTVITDSRVGDGVRIGPFCHIRPGSDISGGVKIGDFVEVKNSALGRGTKVPHLSYVGDSDVGERVNFGCGCVTVNYDGKNKERTKVGDGVFIGCNANLIAPVRVGDGGYIAAGSTITDDVPGGGFAIARARQRNKEGWTPPWER